MTELNVLMTFTGGLAAALVLGFVAKRLRLSPIVGYLIAGVAVGPFTPGYVADHHVAEQFAEIGVILLLFGIGLRFHLQELLAVWRIALPGALFQSAISTMALAVLLRLVGYDWQSGIVLGIAISVASTVVMALVLAERRDLHAPIGHIAIGWTVVEDLLTVTALLLLPMFVGEGANSSGVGAALGEAALKIGALVALVVVLGKWVIPWSLEHIAAARSRELFTLSVLVIALGIAVGAAKLFGVSMALGAFLAGLAVGRSEFAARAANDALPMKDAFAVLFFVSVGMLCDPRSLVGSPLLVALVLLVVVVGKPLAAMAVVRVLGKPLPTAVAVGAALSQVGEFSFILGATAKGLGVIDESSWNALIGASILSIALNPTIYRLARRLTGGAPALAPATGERPPVDPRRCVLVGHGPVGSTVRRILAEHDTEVTVVELNLDTVRSLRAQGQRALYGDVLRPGTLEEAGIATAGSLILSVELEDAAELIRQARIANPSLKVLARCAHLREATALHEAGATVIAGEAEVAIALAEVLRTDKSDDANPSRDPRLEATRRRLYQAQASG
ncbi:MAG: cation:proton antiporter [Labilithrix sp.]|nr:cation:proton antiporter [Labilithrix sp.]